MASWFLSLDVVRVQKFVEDEMGGYMARWGVKKGKVIPLQARCGPEGG